MTNDEKKFTEMLAGFQVLIKGILLKDKKTMMKLMTIENDITSLMEKQLELEAAIRGGKIPKRGLGLFRRALYRFGIPRYSKKEMAAVQQSEAKLESQS